MDTNKVDLLLQYVLAVATEADNLFSRRLGKIHLLKYVYLADLAHAEKHGTTFTNAPWRFYHYGPWDAEICNRADPVLEHLNAEKFIWQSTNYDNDSVRWSIDPEDAQLLIRDLDRKLPLHITLALRRAVREFGNDTSALLHHVYTTAPMLHAAPNQFLDFSIIKAASTPVAHEPDEAEAREPTAKELKRRKETMLKLKEKVQSSLSAPKSGMRKPPAIKPIYDDVFVNGARQMDALAGPSPDGLAGEAALSDDIWISEGRKSGRLP
jgi:hypothetical protein